MTFSGITTTLSNNAKQMNMLVQNIGTNMKTTFGPIVSNLNDSIDVLKAGGDVVSAVVKDVTGENVTIRSIQKGAADFDSKWDAFAKEVNEKFANTSQANQANIMETFAKSHFGNEVYNVGSAIKNELPGVLDGIADYKETIDKLKTNSKTAEETATKIKKGVDTIVKATEKVAGSLNNAIKICTGNGYPVLDTLSSIGGTPSIANLNKVLNLGVAGATTATVANQLKESLKNKDLRGVTDAMVKGATSVNDLLTQLQSISQKFPNVQIPVQITNSIQRLKDGQAVYDAAGSMLTALVADASGQVTISSLATLTSNFNKNWDTFSSKIDALFQITPGNGQQAVLETVAKTMFSQNVYNAGSAIKRQLPGVLSGVAGVQDAFKQFGGSYRNSIEAATKIRNGVEKMVQSIEQISQSLNEMAKTWHGNGQGYPLLDALGNLSGTKGIKILDTVLRVGGGAAAVAGNAGVLAQAIKNKDIKGTIDAAKKAFDDIKNLTKKGKYDSKSLTANSPTPTTSKGSQNNASSNNQQQSQQNNQGSVAQSDSYVCSGATMRCSMGTSQAKLTVLPVRTVYLTGQPMANISDHLSMVNLEPFGKCRSLGFPATASATAANHGSLTPMPCMHNTPFPWMSGKNDYIVKGDPALLKSSTCSCMWGGTISITDDGQIQTGPADLSRKEIIVFEKNQPHIKSHTIQPLSKHTNDKASLLERELEKNRENKRFLMEKHRESISENVSPEQLALKFYGTENVSSEKKEQLWNELRKARKCFAETFYENNYTPLKNSSLKDKQRYIASSVNCIDFNQPVKEGEMPPPHEVYRYELPHSNTNSCYCFDIGQDMEIPDGTKLGIHNPVIIDGVIVRKELVKYKVNELIAESRVCLISTARPGKKAPKNNDWSDRSPDNMERTKGGAKQIYAPNLNKFIKKI